MMITETLQREITQLYICLMHHCCIRVILILSMFALKTMQPDAHRLEHQLTFEQFSEKQIEQPSFFDQIKEYRSKHKKSSYDQYRERTNSKRKNVNFHRPRRRYNRQLKSPSNNHYAKNLSVGYIIRPEKRYNFQQNRYNFFNLASNRCPPPPPGTII